jgi:hypothetical protein
LQSVRNVPGLGVVSLGSRVWSTGLFKINPVVNRHSLNISCFVTSLEHIREYGHSMVNIYFLSVPHGGDMKPEEIPSRYVLYCISKDKMLEY